MADEERKPFDLEKVYDDEITPLMTRIIEICNKHKLPMFATFLYANDPEGENGFCTTNLMYRERPIPEELLALEPSIRGYRGKALRLRVKKNDGTIEETVILP